MPALLIMTQTAPGIRVGQQDVARQREPGMRQTQQQADQPYRRRRARQQNGRERACLNG